MNRDELNGLVYCVLIPGVAAGVLAGLLIDYILTPAHHTPPKVQTNYVTDERIYLPSELRVNINGTDYQLSVRGDGVVVGRKVEK